MVHSPRILLYKIGNDWLFPGADDRGAQSTLYVNRDIQPVTARRRINARAFSTWIMEYDGFAILRSRTDGDVLCTYIVSQLQVL